MAYSQEREKKATMSRGKSKRRGRQAGEFIPSFSKKLYQPARFLGVKLIREKKTGASLGRLCEGYSTESKRIRGTDDSGSASGERKFSAPVQG